MQASTIVGHVYVRLTVCVKRLLGTLWEYRYIPGTVSVFVSDSLFRYVLVIYLGERWKNIKNQLKEKFCARANSG